MKYTERKSGDRRATFRMRFHVPEAMVEFLVEHAGLTRPAAERWIVDHWHDLTEDDNNVAVGEDGETMVVRDIDRIGVAVEYDGPRIVVTR